ncbi:unnamed protein product [Malus baccata var. baccata]
MPPSIEALAMAGADYLQCGITLNELGRQSQPSHLLVDAYRSDIDIFNSLNQRSSSSHSQKEGCNLGYYNKERKGGGNELKRDTLIITKKGIQIRSGGIPLQTILQPKEKANFAERWVGYNLNWVNINNIIHLAGSMKTTLRKIL